MMRAVRRLFRCRQTIPPPPLPRRKRGSAPPTWAGPTEWLRQIDGAGRVGRLTPGQHHRSHGRQP